MQPSPVIGFKHALPIRPDKMALHAKINAHYAGLFAKFVDTLANAPFVVQMHEDGSIGHRRLPYSQAL